MSSGKNKEGINADRKDKSEVSAIAGLLDFYSDRAEAQASFVVACVFGLFTLLAVVQGVKDIRLISLSIIPCLTIGSIGFHCLQRFSFYANMSEQIRAELEKYANPKNIRFKREIEGELKEVTLQEYQTLLSKEYGGILSWFKKPRRLKWARPIAAILFFGLPFLVVYLPKLGL